MSGCAQMVVYGVLVLVLVLDVHKWWYIWSIRVWRMRRRRRNSVYYVRECMTIPHPHVYYSAGPSLRRSYPLCVFPWLPSTTFQVSILENENGLFLIHGSGTSSARKNKNLRPLLNTNIPLVSGKYGLRNHFWPLESRFSHEEKWEKGPNFWGP